MKNVFSRVWRKTVLYNRADECAPASLRGSALILVLVTVMAVMLLASTALVVTSNSREITGLYMDYSGVYDMALAGNEHAFLIYKNCFNGYIETLPEESGVVGDGETGYKQAAADLFKSTLIIDGFAEANTHDADFILEWNAEVIVNPGGITEIYAGKTKITEESTGFVFKTEVKKTVDGQTGFPAVVRSDIEWVKRENALNSFDCYDLPVLKSKRI